MSRCPRWATDLSGFPQPVPSRRATGPCSDSRPGSGAGSRQTPCGYGPRGSSRGSRGACLPLDRDRVEHPGFPEALPRRLGDQRGQGELVGLSFHPFLILGLQIVEEAFRLACSQMLTTCPNSCSKQNQKWSSRSCRRVKPITGWRAGARLRRPSGCPPGAARSPPQSRGFPQVSENG